MYNAIIALTVLSSFFFFFVAAGQAFAQEQITLEASSDQGTFLVEIIWTPAEIGSAHVFDIRFVEPETGEEIEDIQYDFSIYGSGDREVLRRDQTAIRQEFTFEKTGSYEIRIDDIEGLGEGVAIPIQVTPEFPLGAFALSAIAFSIAMLAVRRSSNNLFRQKSK